MLTGWNSFFAQAQAACLRANQQQALQQSPTVVLTASMSAWVDLFTDGDLSSDLLDLIEAKASSATVDTVSISLPERDARTVLGQARELCLDIGRSV